VIEKNAVWQCIIIIGNSSLFKGAKMRDLNYIQAAVRIKAEPISIVKKLLFQWKKFKPQKLLFREISIKSFANEPH
jgi:hypothetical protein